MGGGKDLTKEDKRACQDNEIEPLSGKPYFHMLLQKSHVNTASQLILPTKFSRILPLDKVRVILTYGSRKWEMNYLGDHSTHKRFDQNWRTFVIDNKLKVGDICVFELIDSVSECRGTIKFKVQILRGDFPSELMATRHGTPNKPIVID